MALLNCAWCLASHDRKVLMIDLDLDSPGLSFICPESEGADRPAAQLGMIDILDQFAVLPNEFSGRAVDVLKAAIVPFTLPEAVPPKALAKVSLLPAGDLTDNYISRISALRWHDPPLSSKIEEFATTLRQSIIELAEFDYVLIDCRTGWSESGYVACRLLADHIIAFCALNEQNARGTAHFLAKVASWGEDTLAEKRQIALVASPVPEWEEESKRERIAQVYAILAGSNGDAPEFTLQLPYHPSVAIREQCIVSCWPDSSLSLRYFGLTQCMLEMNEDSADQLDKMITDAIDLAMRKTEFDPKLRPSFVIEKLLLLRGVAPVRFSKMARYSRLAFIRQGKVLLDSHNVQSVDYFEAAIDVADELEDLDLRLDGVFSKGEALKRFGYYNDARKCYSEAQRLSTKEDMKELCSYAVADLDRLCYRLDDSEKSFATFLKVSIDAGKAYFHAAAAIALGDIHRLKRQFDQSVSYFRIGIESATACKDERLTDLAKIYLSYLNARTSIKALTEFRLLVADPTSQHDVSLHIKGNLLLSELEGLSRNLSGSLKAAVNAYQLACQYSLDGYMSEAAALVAMNYSKEKDFDAAIKYAAPALAFFEREGVAHPLLVSLKEMSRVNSQSAKA